LKSTNINARGRNIVEEPKPAIVPIISAIRAEMKNSIFLLTALHQPNTTIILIQQYL
jgi:hypothetical protein